MKCQHKGRTRCTLKGWEELIVERLEEEARMCPVSGLLDCACPCRVHATALKQHHVFVSMSDTVGQFSVSSSWLPSLWDVFVEAVASGSKNHPCFPFRAFFLSNSGVSPVQLLFSSHSMEFPFRPLAPADLEFQPQTPACVSSWSEFYFIHLCSHGGSLAAMLSASSPEESIRS